MNSADGCVRSGWLRPSWDICCVRGVNTARDKCDDDRLAFGAPM